MYKKKKKIYITKKFILLSLIIYNILFILLTSVPTQAVLPINSIINSLPFSDKKQQEIPSLAPMLSKVLPTVVNVYVEGTQVIQKPMLPKEFKYFFGPDLPGENNIKKPFEGLGSGVIIDAHKGLIVTNHHVINRAEKIKIQLHDGREFIAKLVGCDKKTDLALLKITNTTNLSAIQIANSDELKVGDFAIAVGNPFGLGQTATSGIISALGRSGLHLEGLENFIQTDASINRGNSGGALVNLNGELIGINTAILTPGGGNIGIGFAIPSNIVKNLINQIMTYGKVKRGQLGIKGTELTADIAKALNINAQRGAFVSEVLPKSAAEKAGIKSGDIIIAIEDKPINSFSELRVKIAITPPGHTIKLTLLRNTQHINVLVILDDSVSEENHYINNAEILIPSLQGASLTNGCLKDGRLGVKVTNILKNSKASFIGLQKDDLIIGVNRESIKNLSQLKTSLEKKLSVIVLNIIRGETNIFLLLR